MIAAAGGPRPQAAKAATTTIPIVFTAARSGQLGLVASLSRPGGNVTGVSLLAAEMATKRLELLHDLVPGALAVAVLVNPDLRRAEVRVKTGSGGPPSGCKPQYYVSTTRATSMTAFATWSNARRCLLVWAPTVSSSRAAISSLRWRRDRASGHLPVPRHSRRPAA